MRFLTTGFVGVTLVSTALMLGGCLPAYNGENPNDGGTKPDLTEPAAPTDMATAPVMVDQMSTGALSLTLDKPSSNIRLNESLVVNVTINGNGQTGTAVLSLANAPAGVTATFVPASVTLGSTAQTSVMTVTAASTADAASNIAANVTAMVGSTPSTTTFGVSVIEELVIHIPKGIGATHATEAFPQNLAAKLPANGKLPIDIYNDDDTEHQIHADGNSGGMTHEQGELTVDDGPVSNNGVATGVNYYQTFITKTGTASFYCHDHGASSAKPGTIVVTQ